jgi:hypothetical protein
MMNGAYPYMDLNAKYGKLLGRKFSFTIAVLFGNLFNKTAMKKQGTFFQIFFSSQNLLFLGAASQAHEFRGPRSQSRKEKTRVYFEQGKQNKMCASVNM